MKKSDAENSAGHNVILAQKAAVGDQLAQVNAVQPIGTVDVVAGRVVVVRADGTREQVNEGMAVYQGDTLETGGNGAVGVVFLDSSTFSLGEKGQMVMDEMVYDAGAQEGSAAINVVQGVFTFVSGEIAKTGIDAMTISTPTAVIGIRGTTIAGKVAPGSADDTGDKGLEEQGFFDKGSDESTILTTIGTGLDTGLKFSAGTSNGTGVLDGSQLAQAGPQAPGATQIVLLPDADGTVGEATVGNGSGFTTLSQANQGTSVQSAFQPPSNPAPVSQGFVNDTFGGALNANPGSSSFNRGAVQERSDTLPDEPTPSEEQGTAKEGDVGDEEQTAEGEGDGTPAEGADEGQITEGEGDTGDGEEVVDGEEQLAEGEGDVTDGEEQLAEGDVLNNEQTTGSEQEGADATGEQQAANTQDSEDGGGDEVDEPEEVQAISINDNGGAPVTGGGDDGNDPDPGDTGVSANTGTNTGDTTTTTSTFAPQPAQTFGVSSTTNSSSGTFKSITFTFGQDDNVGFTNTTNQVAGLVNFVEDAGVNDGADDRNNEETTTSAALETDFEGTSGDDILIGNSLDNIFYGSTGSDDIDGLDGTDTLTYQDFTASDLDYSGLTATFKNDQTIMVSATLLGGSNTFVDYGTDLEILVGSQGDDTFQTESRSGGIFLDNPIIEGGYGNDTYSANYQDYGSVTIFDDDGSEDEIYIPGDYNDLVTAYRSGNNLTIELSDATVNWQDTTLTMTIEDHFDGAPVEYFYDGTEWTELLAGLDGSSAMTGSLIVGTDQADSITGSSYGDVIFGGFGDDVITAGEGNDEILGGTGDNSIDGGNGTDSVFYSFLETGISATALSSTNSDWVVDHGTGLDATDTLSSIEIFVGSHGDDVIDGSAVSDWGFGLSLFIDGLDGDDFIVGSDIEGFGDFLGGGFGDDTLSGGLGEDYFIFNGQSRGEGGGVTTVSTLGTDTITDFAGSNDVIALFDEIFGLGTTGGLVDGTSYFETTNTPSAMAINFASETATAGVIVVGASTGTAGVDVYYTENVNAFSSANSYQIATLQGLSSEDVSAGDFALGSASSGIGGGGQAA